jgi:hypothetical protein
MLEKIRHCPKCDLDMDISNFTHSKGRHNRISSYCKKCALTATKLWCKNNRPKISESRKKTNKKNKNRVYTKLGGVCSSCGFSDMRALQIDHINGGGKKDRKKYRTSDLYAKILRDSTGYQILCANCNWIKRHDKGEGYKIVF